MANLKSTEGHTLLSDCNSNRNNVGVAGFFEGPTFMDITCAIRSKPDAKKNDSYVYWDHAARYSTIFKWKEGIINDA